MALRVMFYMSIVLSVWIATLVFASDVCENVTENAKVNKSNEVNVDWYIAQVKANVRRGDVILRLAWESDGRIERAALEAGARQLVILLYEEADISAAERLLREYPKRVEIVMRMDFEDLYLDGLIDVLLVTDLDGRDILRKGITFSLPMLRKLGYIHEDTKIIPQCLAVSIGLAVLPPELARDGIAPSSQSLEIISNQAVVWKYNFAKGQPRSEPRLRRLALNHTIDERRIKGKVLGTAVWIKPHVCSTSPKNDWEPTQVSAFIPSMDPWLIDSSQNQVRVYAGTVDTEFSFYVAPASPVMHMDASTIKLITGADMPIDFDMPVARRPIVFLKSECKSPVDLYRVVLGSREFFLKTLQHGEEFVLERFSQAERVEVRNGDNVLQKFVLEDKHFTQNPLNELMLIFNKC